MQKLDVHLLGSNLNALAEAFDHKPVTPKALEIWFDTLKEFPTELVMSMLISWPKLHGKFPMPAEVWRLSNDIGATDRERKAVAERAASRQTTVYAGTTEQGKNYAAQVVALCSRTRRAPIGHWHKLLARSHPDSIGHQYATEALKVLQPKRAPVREPGEDG